MQRATYTPLRGLRLAKSLRKRLSASIRYKFVPKCADFLTAMATFEARRRLRATGVRRVLVDNTVLAHAITHETAWVDTGKSTWGGLIEIDTGYSARIPVHREDDQSDAARSVRYLPGIAHLAKRGHLVLTTSFELIDEHMTQKAGRYSGYGYFDFSLFRGVQFETISDPDYEVIGGGYPGEFPSYEEQRRTRLAQKQDSLFNGLLSALGPKNSQDAWHITTAERNDCFCFLTMDFRLIRALKAQAGNEAVQALRTLVVTPETFGKRFGIRPIPPRLFSYHEASFPVVHAHSWPDSKRHPPMKRD